MRKENSKAGLSTASRVTLADTGSKNGISEGSSGSTTALQVPQFKKGEQSSSPGSPASCCSETAFSLQSSAQQGNPLSTSMRKDNKTTRILMPLRYKTGAGSSNSQPVFHFKVGLKQHNIVLFSHCAQHQAFAHKAGDLFLRKIDHSHDLPVQKIFF